MEVSFIILAAGQGTRMRSAIPKVLHTLAGKPLLQHVVDCALAAGADEVCVVHGHGGDAVKAAFDGQPIRWVHQAEQLGTGHAAQRAMPGTPDANRVLILFGDVPLLKPATLKRLLQTGKENELALLTVDMQDPTGYGRIVREDGRVVRNVEHKDASPAEQA
ncbi:MAG TPA: NTP transferase domain-containing protein, partial [Woeseiaceae bacterium]|nr:NTP transferase domain-containing protein [Woeseiaceae bacterium]